MNPIQIRALQAWIDNLLQSAKLTELGMSYDEQLGTWRDPRKLSQYPYDTIHDPIKPERWQVLAEEQKKKSKGHSRYGRMGGAIPMDVLESKTAPRGLLGPRKRKY